MSSLRSDCHHLLTALSALEGDAAVTTMGVATEGVVSVMSTLTEHVKQLTAHCNVMLVNDSLRDWDSSQADRGSTPDTNAVSHQSFGYSLCGCVGVGRGGGLSV